MPAIQEFLASYAVKVDEAGLYRLQQALEQNRDKASRVQAAFAAALSSVDAFSASLKDFTFHPDQLKLPESVPLKIMPELAQDAKLTLPDSFIMKVIPELDQDTPLSFPERIALKVSADMTEADAAASDFVSRLSALRPSISANASGITTAVSNAVSRARSLVSGLNLTIKFTPKVSETEVTDEEPVALGTGGRISRPTFAQIAEEGDPEYVIPVKNDDRAVPLLRQLFSELSADATERLFGIPESPVSAEPVSFSAFAEAPSSLSPEESGFASPMLSPDDSKGLPLERRSCRGVRGARETWCARSDLLSTNLSSITNNTVNTHHEVSAPVNINVTSTGPTAEAVGKTVYNAAERALVRTLEGVFA